MKRVTLFLSSVILLVMGGYAIPPFSLAHNLFTRSYMIPERDNPSCMRLFWQTDTALHGGWIRWGYHEDHLDNLEDANSEHQNIKNEVHKGQRAQDFIRWDSEICAEPGVPIYYEIYVSEHQDYDDHKAKYTIGPGWFVLPLPPDARHLTFFGYGDNRNGDKFDDVSSWLKGNVENDPINRKTFLLHSGDICYNGGQTFEQYKDNEWSHYFHKYESARTVLSWMPVMAAQGNHDFNWQGHYDTSKYFFTNWPYPQYVDSIGMVPYIDEKGKLVSKSTGSAKDAVSDAYYSFDYGPVHVAVVNSYSEFNDWDHLGRCSIGDGLKKGHTEYKWLKKDLLESDKPWKVILTHVSPLSCDCSITDDVRHDIEFLAQTGGVDLLVSGHDHYYKRTKYNDLWHFVLGGAGAPLDCGDSCKICVYHYARFHVVNDGELKIEVFGHYDDASSSSFYDTLTINKAAPITSTAGFEVSLTSADYRYPRRFSCASPGIHSHHLWDFGDTTSSTEENPLHSYQKPTDPSGIETYTASLRVSTDGTNWLAQTEKEITVYIQGSLEPIVNVGMNKYALFLRPKGEPLDEIADFQGIYWYPGIPQYEHLMPGDYTLTIRALGYQDWEKDITIHPDKGEMPRIYPQPIPLLNATVAIGSVPTGADVTVTLGLTTLTGTTPFYKEICCSDDWFSAQCTFDYTVKKGAIEVKGAGDISTKKTEGGCENEIPGLLANVYVDLRPAGQEAGGGSGLVIMSQPSDQETVEDAPAHLRISARSRDRLTYRWYEGISGDTSKPIYGATGPIYITPELTEAKDYWVRVNAGQNSADSRTAWVTVTDPTRGPELTGALPPYASPTSQITLQGLRFDPGEYGENRVFFGEYEASVESATETECVVTAPYELETGESVDLQIEVSDIWSNTIQLEARDGLPVLQSGDYDGDGKSDIALFRPDTGLWAVRGLGRLYFGTDGDIPVSGDYNGDGYTDVSIFRPSSGLWAVKGVTRAYFGDADDIPVPGDYDGDGSCDIAVLGRTTARWAVRGISRVYFGRSDNYPVPGDYNGDGRTDIAAFLPSSGLWAIRNITRSYFGRIGDIPLPGVYRWYGTARAAGPFKTQIAIFRPTTGLWAIRGLSRFYFGTSGDTPIRGNFSGSQLDDPGIFRGTTGLWAIRALTRTYFGESNDSPATR